MINTLRDTVAEELAACGTMRAYDPQLNIPEIAGSRVVKCLYQVNKKTGKKVAENAYCRLALGSLTEELIVARIKELAPYVLTFLQEKENDIVKGLHRGGASKIYSTSLGMDAVMTELEAAGTSARLSKEDIEAWYDSVLAEEVTVRFADKIGIPADGRASQAELDKLESIVAAYKMKFAALAAPVPKLSKPDCSALAAVIRACDMGLSLIGERFITRLDKLAMKDEDLLLAL